jgi:ribosome-associated protein
MNDPLEIKPGLVIPADDLSYEFTRSGGPGGQHVNTTDSKVRLRFAFESCAVLRPDVKDRLRAARGSDINDEGELLITCDVHRSRQMNIDEARERLVALIQAFLVPPRPRKKTKPSYSSQLRRVEGKAKRGDVKAGRRKVQHDD